MSIIIDALPSAYEYDGRVYDMQTDFREWMKFELLLTDTDIPINDKSRRLLELVFPQIPPDENLWDFILWFYQCGKEGARASKKAKSQKQTAIYSFEYDDGYIYSAFREIYNINLITVPYLHWWEFKSMFRALHDCKIVDIMGYRSEKISRDTPEYHKKFLTEMKRVYALPKSLTEQQKLAELKRIKENIEK